MKWLLPDCVESRFEPFLCFQFFHVLAAMPNAADAATGGGTSSFVPGSLECETVFPAQVGGKLGSLCFYGEVKGKNKGNGTKVDTLFEMLL